MPKYEFGPFTFHVQKDENGKHYLWSAVSYVTGWSDSGNSSTKDGAIAAALRSASKVFLKEAKALAKSVKDEIYDSSG